MLAAEFPEVPGLLADALTYCDMPASPDGKAVPLRHRRREIHARYGDEHPVSRSISRATPRLAAAVEAIERRRVQRAGGRLGPVPGPGRP